MLARIIKGFKNLISRQEKNQAVESEVSLSMHELRQAKLSHTAALLAQVRTPHEEIAADGSIKNARASRRVAHIKSRLAYEITPGETPPNS